jgi:NADPH:quinone reductase-like Zn-dependent oxidoreductase
VTAERRAPEFATAYWTVAAGTGELRRELLAPPVAGEVLVRTLFSGVSRGTEMLVHRHSVPAEIADAMRAPHQEGDLPGPVKYGYLAVGVVEAAGPDALPELVGQRVFCLHPHQDWFVVPATDVVPLPEGLPSERAVLAGTVETAVNALWDGGPRIGDRVAVVGAGMVGLSTALLLDAHPLQRLQVVESDPRRRDAVAALGLEAVPPEEAATDCDLVFHASATSAGLATALALLGNEGEVIELSWHGIPPVEVPLGGAFHARRLTIRSSQVGTVSPARSARRTYAGRLAVALAALADERFGALLTPAVPLADLPLVVAEIASGERSVLCQLVSYPPTESLEE